MYFHALGQELSQGWLAWLLARERIANSFCTALASLACKGLRCDQPTLHNLTITSVALCAYTQMSWHSDGFPLHKAQVRGFWLKDAHSVTCNIIGLWWLGITSNNVRVASSLIKSPAVVLHPLYQLVLTLVAYYSEGSSWTCSFLKSYP